MRSSWVVLAVFVSGGAAAECSMVAPEGWTRMATGPREVASYLEPYSRENVVVRSRISLRTLESGTLDEGVRAARAEEQEALGERPSFELVRDRAMPGAKLANHLLVYRYRLVAGGPAVLRFHAVYSNGFRVVHAIAESQASALDALELPYREAGLHETKLRPALMSVECAR